MGTGSRLCFVQAAIVLVLVIFQESVAEEIDNSLNFEKVDCGKNFTTPSGNFNESLGSNATHCLWQITLPSANQTAIIFNPVKLIQTDHIKVFDGSPGANDTNLVVKITGKIDKFLAVTFSKVIYIELIKVSNTSISLSFNYNSKDCQVSYLSAYTKRVISPSYLPNRGQVKCRYSITGLTTFRDKVAALAFTTFKVTKGNITVSDGNQTIHTEGSASGHLPDDFISTQTLDIFSSISLDFTLDNTTTVQKFDAFFNSVDQKCSGVLNVTDAPTININIPMVESPLTDCRMILQANPGNTILLNLTTVRLKNGADRVVVNDGGSLGSQVVSEFTSIPKDGYLVASSGNKLWIRLVFGELTGERTLKIAVSERNQGGRFYKDGNLTLPKNATEDAYFYQFVAKEGQVSVTLHDNITMYPNTSLDFYDGTQLDSKLLTSFTTQKQFFPVTSSGRSLLLVARNFADQETFSADYKFVGQSCDQVLSAPFGSYNFSSVNQKFCRWTVQPVNSFGLISLTLDALSLAANQTLTVYSGVMEYGITLATFDIHSIGQQLPSFTALVTNGIELVYESNNTCKNCSTPIIAASYKVRQDCNGDLKTETGVIKSPDYPNSYGINTDCVWNAVNATTNTTSNVTTPHYLFLTFSDLQLGQGHWVRVKDSINSTSRVLADYQGSTLPDDIIVSAETASVEFSAQSAMGNGTYHTSRGFKANYWNLDCGGNFTTRNATGQFTTPEWPHPVVNSTLCVWIVQFPVHGQNSTVRNSAMFRVVMSNQNKNMSNGALTIHDGGSVRDPLVHFNYSNGKTGDIIARTNTIVVVYNFTAAADKNEGGFSVSVNFSAFSCHQDKQCGGNGVCIHPDWVCNGVDNCGDMSDEKNCATVNGKMKGMVKSYWIAVCLLLGLLFGAVLAFLIPAIYRRFKYPNYSQLRDLSAPVIT